VKVVAVVLNWRRPTDTVACVRSLRETAPDAGVVVVDNASGDDSLAVFAEQLPGTTVVVNDRNAGYAGGNNAGIEAALSDGADAVLVLNNDVVVTPGCVEALTAYLTAHPRVPMAAPLSLLGETDVVDFYRARVDVRSMALDATGRDEPWDGPPEPAPTDYATGSAMLVRAEVLRETGLFDERFFLVWEDVDLCLRVRAATDERPVVVPAARVRHGRSASFGGDGSPLFGYFFARNSFLVLAKHGKPWWRWRTRRLLVRRYRVAATRAAEPMRTALTLGLRDGLRRRWGPAPDDLAALLERPPGMA